MQVVALVVRRGNDAESQPSIVGYGLILPGYHGVIWVAGSRQEEVTGGQAVAQCEILAFVFSARQDSYGENVLILPDAKREGQ